MMTRKEMKRRAKEVVRRHYGILVVVCLIASFIGAEFSSSLDFVRVYREDSKAVGEGISPETGATIGVYRQSMDDTLLSLVEKGVPEARKVADEIKKEDVKRDAEENHVLGRSRGVLAGVINEVTSGGVIVMVTGAMEKIGASASATLSIMICLALAVWFAVWFFFLNMYTVVSRRMFLEGRTYEKLSVQRLLAIHRVRCWSNVSLTMFMNSLFYTLWSFTIVGGFIKRYSYYMVPYIAAENPAMGWKETITLSRRIMNGHKWECFVMEVSFLFWNILGWLTMGIVNVLFINPYKVAFFAEYYAQLRRLAIDGKLENWQALNDRYLFEKAGSELLKETYADIEELKKMPGEAAPLTGFRGVLANIFGITIFNRADEEKYQAAEERKLKLAAMEQMADGEAYPSRLSVIHESEKNSRVETLHYLRRYSVTSLILLFFIFAFVGWLWEVSLHLISDGVFVNRGVLHGPWLPIYGTGGVLILVVLNKFRKKPLLEFFAAVVLCGCVEYFTAYSLEMTHNGQKWWDYSGYFLNLHGRICAEGLLIFGLGGIAIVYLLAPLLDNHLRKIKYGILIPLCAVLLIVFSADQVYSKKHPNTGKGITSYGVNAGVVQERDLNADRIEE